jgi:thermostable 8-oxoguanine DNA glycosylase
LDWLQRPLNLGNRSVRYRFARQKARYLAQALAKLDRDDFEGLRDQALRDALLALPGIGYKTASWITRNWLDSDAVAILDIHIVRAGLLAGFFDPSLSVERHYSRLEAQFLTFSEGLGVRASELDAVIWAEMMASPQSVAQAMQALPASALKAKQGLAGQRARQRGAHTNQLPLLS